MADTGCLSVDRDSSVTTATCYGLDGPMIESYWWRDYPHPSRPSLEPTQSPVQRVPALARGYNDRGVALKTQPHLAQRLKKEFIPPRPFWAFMACPRFNFTYVYIYIYVYVCVCV